MVITRQILPVMEAERQFQTQFSQTPNCEYEDDETYSRTGALIKQLRTHPKDKCLFPIERWKFKSRAKYADRYFSKALFRNIYNVTIHAY